MRERGEEIELMVKLRGELLSVNVPWSQEFSGVLKFWI